MTASESGSTASKSTSNSSVSVHKSSPLKQVNEQQPNGEPVQHKLKVVALYECLFQNKDHLPGYWVELFLLPVNSVELGRVLESQATFSNEADMATIQTLVKASLANMSTELPLDIVSNALKILETVICTTLDLCKTSKHPIPSVIHILTGIEHASTVFDELSERVLALISYRKQTLVAQATQFVLNVSKRTWGTQLGSLFSTKNYFAAFIKIIDVRINEKIAVDAFTCIGVLTALDIYDEDSTSRYQQRISDYVDETVMTKILAMLQREISSENQILQQTPGIVGWVSSLFGSKAADLEVTTPTNGTATSNAPNSSKPNVLLTLYLFVLHNPVFASQFAASPALVSLLESTVTAIADMKSPIASSHVWLVFLLLRHITDSDFPALIDPSLQTVIKLQTSKLDLDTSRRVPMAGIFDICIILLRTACVQKNPDWLLLEQVADLLYQTFVQMAITKSIWLYNWAQLWKILLYVVKALSTRVSKDVGPVPETISTIASRIKSPKNAETVVNRLLISLVGICLRRDLLDEEDWSFLLFSIVKNPHLFQQVGKRFPNLNHSLSLSTVKAMTAQYELNKDQPDFTVILKQGKLAAGAPLIGDKLRPFSVHREPIVKWAVKQQVTN